jgi:hypothetical protein
MNLSRAVVWVRVRLQDHWRRNLSARVQRDTGTATLQSPERCATTATFVAGIQFGSGTEPVRTVLDEFRILRGQSFEPVDYRSDVVAGG